MSTTYTPKAKTPKAIEKELQRFAHEFERQVRDGEYLSGEKLTFEECVSYWKTQWAKKSLTQSTYESYILQIEGRAYPTLKGLKMSRIMPLHIQSIINQMEEEGKAPKTVKRTYVAINSVFKYAYRMKLIKENPCERCELPKIQKDTGIHYFTLEQAKTFLEALTLEYTDTYKGHSRIDDTGKPYTVAAYTERHTIPFQYRVLFNLAIYGGFRRGELVALKWTDIDFEKASIKISRAAAKVAGGQVIKEPKTVSGNREIVMPRQTMVLLREWKLQEIELSLKLGSAWEGSRGRDFDENFVFIQLDSGNMMHLDTVGHKFKEILERYNRSCKSEEEKLPLIRLHDLRHTSATLLISEGVDIETISHRLGHAHASITLDIYGHPLPSLDEKAAQTLGRLFAEGE